MMTKRILPTSLMKSRAMNASNIYTLPKKWDNVFLAPLIPSYYKAVILHHGVAYTSIVTNQAWIDKFQAKEFGWKKVGEYLYDYVKNQNSLH